MKQLHVTEWYRRFMREQVKPGDICIDATIGKGADTELLCELAGDEGLVLGFDIQKEALDMTDVRLTKAGYRNFRLFLSSHEHMVSYAKEESISCIVFNLGYLPGGNHQIATKGDTTIEALRQGLRLLKRGGIICLCIYRGGDSGYQEMEEVLAWLRGLDYGRYLVVMSEYYNRPNDPPIPVLIIKN